MNLPKGEPRPWHALGMHLVEHQPAANAYALLHLDECRDPVFRPPGVRHTNARRDLNDDALALALVRLLRQPEVVVPGARVCRVAVRRLRRLELLVGDIPFNLDGRALKSRDVARLASRPLVAEPIPHSTREWQSREHLP